MGRAPFVSGLPGEPGEFIKQTRLQDIKINPTKKARQRRIGWMERSRGTPATRRITQRITGERDD